MLGIVAPPAVPPQGGGVAEVILAIVSSVILVVGVAIWIRTMTRQARPSAHVTIVTPARFKSKVV